MTTPPPPQGDDDARARSAALRPTQEWFVAELRDECSAIGVSAHGFDLEGFIDGVRIFAREARRLGAPPERMVVLLKQCLADQRIPHEDRELYLHYRTTAVTTAIGAYYEAPGPSSAPSALRPDGPIAP